MRQLQFVVWSWHLDITYEKVIGIKTIYIICVFWEWSFYAGTSALIGTLWGQDQEFWLLLKFLIT